jgi:hypothetical protein
METIGSSCIWTFSLDPTSLVSPRATPMQPQHDQNDSDKHVPSLIPESSTTQDRTPDESSASLEERRQKLLVFLRAGDFSNEKLCYDELVRFLHPDGLHCPRCHAKDGLRVHRRDRDPVVCDICSSCFAVFNAWTGTVIQGVHRRPSEILYILSRVIDGVPTARIARDLGCHRRGVLSLRRRLEIAIKPACACLREPRTSPADDGPASPGEGNARD